MSTSTYTKNKISSFSSNDKLFTLKGPFIFIVKMKRDLYSRSEIF